MALGHQWGSSEEPLQLDFAVVLHPCEVTSHCYRATVDEVFPEARLTVPLGMEMVIADAQINAHTRLIGSMTVSLKVSHT